MITVLTASYNGSSYIVQQLDSILAQSREDIQILVSDDCSVDGSREILKAYEDSHKGRVVVLWRRWPSGGAALHFLKLLKLMGDLGERQDRGMEEILEEYEPLGEAGQALAETFSQAEYFMLSDQDDVWLKTKGERLLEKITTMEAQREGEEVPLLVHSDMQVVDEELHVIAPSFFSYQKISPQRTRLSQLLVQNNVTGGGIMVNRAVLPFLSRLPSKCLMHDAWLALVVTSFGRIGYVDEPLYLYRQHGGNTLGAEKGDNLAGVIGRLTDGERARENYRNMFAQARWFLEFYRDGLGEKECRILEKFLQLPERGRLGKMYLILRYGFTKNTFLRTLGQMLFMDV